jgi:hypothetical protein
MVEQQVLRDPYASVARIKTSLSAEMRSLHELVAFCRVHVHPPSTLLKRLQAEICA